MHFYPMNIYSFNCIHFIQNDCLNNSHLFTLMAGSIDLAELDQFLQQLCFLAGTVFCLAESHILYFFNFTE